MLCLRETNVARIGNFMTPPTTDTGMKNFNVDWVSWQMVKLDRKISKWDTTNTKEVCNARHNYVYSIISFTFIRCYHVTNYLRRSRLGWLEKWVEKWTTCGNQIRIWSGSRIHGCSYIYQQPVFKRCSGKSFYLVYFLLYMQLVIKSNRGANVS